MLKFRMILLMITTLLTTGAVTHADENHDFALFGTAQNMYGLHLSMDMDIHRFQVVSKFDLGKDAQTAIAEDHANHPKRSYLLNPIAPNSNEDFFFSLSDDFKVGYTFSASVYACDTSDIWGKCFQIKKTFLKRVSVTVTSLIAFTELSSGKNRAFSPSKYGIINDGEAVYAFPLMNDVVGQFDQILLVKLNSELSVSAPVTLTNQDANQATIMNTGDSWKSKDGGPGFTVISPLIYLDPSKAM